MDRKTQEQPAKALPTSSVLWTAMGSECAQRSPSEPAGGGQSSRGAGVRRGVADVRVNFTGLS